MRPKGWMLHRNLHERGDALTFETSLMTKKRLSLAASVVRSATPRWDTNQPVLFDPNLDPTVRKNRATQNLELPKDFMFDDAPLPIARKRKRRCKLSKKQWSKIAEVAQLSGKRVANWGGGGLLIQMKRLC
jgi:hypothetical protein